MYVLRLLLCAVLCKMIFLLINDFLFGDVLSCLVMFVMYCYVLSCSWCTMSCLVMFVTYYVMSCIVCDVLCHILSCLWRTISCLVMFVTYCVMSCHVYVMSCCLLASTNDLVLVHVCVLVLHAGAHWTYGSSTRS